MIIKRLINKYKVIKAMKDRFNKEYRFFIDQYLHDNFAKEIKVSRTMLYEDTIHTSFDRHYTYFPAWAIRRIIRFKESVHYDIGSTINLSTMLSAVMKVNFYDFRPAKINLSNLICKRADVTQLNFKSNTIHSLSCLHVLEHIGLGRYGDPIDFYGDIKAASELSRVVSKGGNLLVVVPVGKPQIIFNLHRIYSYDQVIALFSSMKLMEFSLIRGSGDNGIIENANPDLVSKESYGCGCFWFIK